MTSAPRKGKPKRHPAPDKPQVFGRKAGRPTAYKSEFAARARELCDAGAIEPELAAEFGVDRRTITNWEQRHPDFRDAIKGGKGAADERVKRSLYERAVGYTFRAVKIFMPAGAKAPVIVEYDEHVPPDVVAARFWLMNRDRDNWTERLSHQVTGKDGGPIEIKDARERNLSLVESVASRIAGRASS